LKLRHFLHLILAATIAVAVTSANAFTSLHIPSTLDLVNRYVADQSKCEIIAADISRDHSAKRIHLRCTAANRND
jgi:hypothetical protein